MAQECTKQLNKKVNFMGTLCCTLAHLRFHFREHFKMHKNVREKNAFYNELMIHLTIQSRGAPEGTFDGASKDALSDLHKDA